MDTFHLPRPIDMHVHFRRGLMMQGVSPYTTNVCRAALIMGNTEPPVLTDEDVSGYKQEIVEAVPDSDEFLFTPLMTFLVTPDTTKKQIERLAQLRPIVGKLLPKNLTTNSDLGFQESLTPLFDVFDTMERWRIPLSIHGEMPGQNIIGRNREEAFLPNLRLLAATFPQLKITLEHITTAAAMDTILALGNNAAATITPHHLLLTADDVCGDNLAPALWCKPVYKDPKDREALIWAATSGCPKFMFGSDSAPHPRRKKLVPLDCRPGAFTAPVAIPLLVEIFEKYSSLSRLGDFVYGNAMKFHNLPESLKGREIIKLVRRSWTVPFEIGGIFAFWGGREISWQFSSQE